MCEKRRLILATHNEHKTQEIRDLIISEDLPYEVVSLHEIGDDLEIEETGETLMENSQLKAETCHRRHHTDCFADDTGLEVTSLGGRPGVYSARYAGPACRPADNIRVRYSDEARDFVADKGFDPKLGARPLKRAV